MVPERGEHMPYHATIHSSTYPSFHQSTGDSEIRVSCAALSSPSRSEASDKIYEDEGDND